MLHAIADTMARHGRQPPLTVIAWRLRAIVITVAVLHPAHEHHLGPAAVTAAIGALAARCPSAPTLANPAAHHGDQGLEQARFTPAMAAFRQRHPATNTTRTPYARSPAPSHDTGAGLVQAVNTDPLGATLTGLSGIRTLSGGNATIRHRLSPPSVRMRVRRSQVHVGHTRLYSRNGRQAISVPDDTFEKATRRAHDLGMSRSEFFARAAARYLDELDAESVTRQIDLASMLWRVATIRLRTLVAVARRLLVRLRVTGDRARRIYWADLGCTVGFTPGQASTGSLVVSAQTYNQSRLATVVALVITVQHRTGSHARNVFLPAAATGLPRDSVVNVTAIVTLNKTDLTEQAGLHPLAALREIDRGLRNSLEL